VAKNTPVPVTEPIEQREACLCGCGGFPKGPKSRFIPGHDARYHSAQKKAAADAARSHEAPVNAPVAATVPARPRARREDTSRAAGSEA
jgi:hypothetical protein